MPPQLSHAHEAAAVAPAAAGGSPDAILDGRQRGKGVGGSQLVLGYQPPQQGAGHRSKHHCTGMAGGHEGRRGGGGVSSSKARRARQRRSTVQLSEAISPVQRSNAVQCSAPAQRSSSAPAQPTGDEDDGGVGCHHQHLVVCRLLLLPPKVLEGHGHGDCGQGRRAGVMVVVVVVVVVRECPHVTRMHGWMAGKEGRAWVGKCTARPAPGGPPARKAARWLQPPHLPRACCQPTR